MVPLGLSKKNTGCLGNSSKHPDVSFSTYSPQTDGRTDARTDARTQGQTTLSRSAKALYTEDMGCIESYSISLPNLNLEQRELIRVSWDKFKEKGPEDGIGWLFLEVFKRKPEAKNLFKSLKGVELTHQAVMAGEDIRNHFKKVYLYFESIVQSIDALQGETESLLALGQRHKKRGVKIEYIKLAGQCLILALRKQLGRDLTPEAEIAWRRLWVYMESALTKRMK